MLARVHPPTLIFVHIPKTGGISLRDTLLAACEPERVFRILHPIDDHAKLAALSADERGRLQLVEGHMYYGVHELIPRPCAYMTILRDPVARIRSFYSYVRRNDWHHLYARIQQESLSLPDCFRVRLTVELDNFMTRALTGLHNIHVSFGGVTEKMFDEARANLDSCAIVGTTDRLGLLYSTMSRVLGLAETSPPHLNGSSPEELGAPPDEGLRDLILEHNRFDQRLYEHARAIAERRAALATNPFKVITVQRPAARAETETVETASQRS
jgi:hypothetical protein